MNTEYQFAVKMYKQYQQDVVKIGSPMNIYQIKTLQLLDENFRQYIPVKLKWYQKLIGSFKNRRK